MNPNPVTQEIASAPHEPPVPYYVLEGINTILKKALTCDSETELGRSCLAVAQEITGSRFAFISEINSTKSPKADIAQDERSLHPYGFVKPSEPNDLPEGVKIHDFYSRLLRDKTGFFINPSRDAKIEGGDLDRIRLPEGPPLMAVMGVPLIHSEKTIGILVVGNREGGYTETTLKTLQSLAPAIVEALMRKRSELANKNLKSKLMADLAAMACLHTLNMTLFGESNLPTLLDKILDAAIMLTEADMGTIQLVDYTANKLSMQVHRGLPRAFLHTFGNIQIENNTVCGKALLTGRRVIVTDIAPSDIFIEEPFLGTMREAGIRAVQCTPIASRSQFFGAISTYWRNPREPHKRQLHYLDILAQQTADTIERFQIDTILEKKVRERTAELETRNAELEALNKIVKKMAHKTIVAMENDRKALSNDLHDSIGSSLAAIKLQLEDRLYRMSSMPPLDAMSFEKIIGHLSDTINETRRISHRLRPLELDDFGLIPALNRNLKDFKQFYPKIQVVAQIRIAEKNIADDIKTVVYRVSQEALNNIGKHSQADRVNFDLFDEADRLSLKISDNGCGFDYHEIIQGAHALCGYGLSNMRERVEICKGEFKIHSAPNQGTVLDITIPIG